MHTYQIALKVSSSLFIKHGLKSWVHLNRRFFLLINASLRVLTLSDKPVLDVLVKMSTGRDFCLTVYAKSMCHHHMVRQRETTVIVNCLGQRLKCK